VKFVKLPFEIDLKNQVAVITGAAGVIPSCISRAVAQCGAKVFLLDINEQKLEETARNIESEGLKAYPIICDVLNRSMLEKAFDNMMEIAGPCNILINGAGGNNPRATTTSEIYQIGQDTSEKTFFDIKMEDFLQTLNLNFIGTVLPVQIFGREMIENPNTHPNKVILNISSMNAFIPLTKIPAYSAAKSAVSNFTHWLSVYFAEANVRVNAIAPGFLSTEQTKALFYEEDGITPTKRLNKILASTPLGKLGKPEELIGTILWLLSQEASSFVTGAVIPIDGGFSSYSGV
jgi:NAD(P)-dependent dehydrogenase (short-subunit alcohol dehydrogenase family)